MALVPRKCPYCDKIFMHENGKDGGGVGIRDANRVKVKGQEGIPAYCPHCVDPCRVPRETYMKRSILTSLRYHLKRHGVDITHITEEDVLPFLDDFPKAYELYYGTTYRTITLHTGRILEGRSTTFELGPPYKNYKRMWRFLKCQKCNRISRYKIKRVLSFFCGFIIKGCVTCDNKGRIENLKRGGTRQPFSDRSLARLLNVSLNDFQRKIKGGTLPPAVPVLPEGTRIKNLQIIEAFWDDRPTVNAPRYRLRCEKCQNVFVCAQKDVKKIDHPCFGD